MSQSVEITSNPDGIQVGASQEIVNNVLHQEHADDENNEEPAFDKLDFVNRIILDDMYESPIDWKEFEKCK